MGTGAVIALIVSSLLSIGGLVASGITSAKAQKQANETNKQLTEETNKANKEMQESVNQANIQLQKEANDTNIALTEANNKANIDLAEKEMAFNSAEAQKARDFEAEMSNTSIQRRMADLQAAGVNPMLALGSPAQMASGYGASASSVRNQAASVDAAHVAASQNQTAHVQAVDGMADMFRSLASVSQSAVTMMALGLMNSKRADSYADSRKYAADKSYDARMSQKTRSYFDSKWNYRGGYSDTFSR